LSVYGIVGWRLTVNKPVNQVFEFFSDVRNGKIGGAIKSVAKGDDNWWLLLGRLRGQTGSKMISFWNNLRDSI
jgi:hypothetical protein